MKPRDESSDFGRDSAASEAACQSLFEAPLCGDTLALLVLLSRRELCKTQRDMALSLCARGRDWSALFAEAERHFVLPLVYRQLRDIGAEVPESALAEARRLAEYLVLNNMKVAAAQRGVMDAVLEPLGVRYLFFKGPSLAARYYDEPSFRLARDIDLLIHEDDLLPVVERALGQGYRTYSPDGLEAGMPNLDLRLRGCKSVTLVGAEGVAIDMQTALDKTRLIYSTEAMLARAERVRLLGRETPVLPLADLFVYLCQHHTRHHWAHLHWLVDLDMLCAHPDFDREAVMRRAEALGLEATVAASLAMYQAAGRALTEEAAAALSAPARELLLTTLDALQGDRDHELDLRRSQSSPDFSFDWQLPPGHLNRYRKQWLRGMFVPGAKDQQMVELPRGLWGLYYVVRPWRIFRDRVLRRGGQR